MAASTIAGLDGNTLGRLAGPPTPTQARGGHSRHPTERFVFALRCEEDFHRDHEGVCGG